MGRMPTDESASEMASSRGGRIFQKVIHRDARCLVTAVFWYPLWKKFTPSTSCQYGRGHTECRHCRAQPPVTAGPFPAARHESLDDRPHDVSGNGATDVVSGEGKGVQVPSFSNNVSSGAAISFRASCRSDA